MTHPQPKTIAFCIEALTVGGAEQMLVAMANEFIERRWQVHMICLSKPGELADKLDASVHLHVLNKKPGADLSLPKRLRALLLGINPIAVNSHLWTANLWTRVSLIRSSIPIVVTEHSRDFWKPRHYRMLDRLLIRTTLKLVAVSNDTADFYKDDIGIAADKVMVINNGVNTKRYANGDGNALKQQWAPNNELLIGTVGRMVEAKNHKRLVQVAALLESRMNNFKIILVGDGELRHAIEAAVESKGVHKVLHLAGARSDIPDVLAAFDLFVLTSDREGHPLTALEAQAAATPVVLTNAGGSADAVASDGVHSGGQLVEKDANAVADAIVDLTQNREALNAMGEFAQHYALQHFDLQHMVDQYETLFTADQGV